MVSWGARAKDELHFVETEAINHEGGPIKVTLATLRTSMQPIVSLACFGVTPPVVSAWKCDTGPVQIRGQQWRRMWVRRGRGRGCETRNMSIWKRFAPEVVVSFLSKKYYLLLTKMVMIKMMMMMMTLMMKKLKKSSNKGICKRYSSQKSTKIKPEWNRCKTVNTKF